MTEIRVNLDEMKASADNLMKAKAGMYDELQNLDAKMNAIREMVSKRLQSDIEFFVAVKGRIAKEFDELDKLKAELDAAVIEFETVGNKGGLSPSV